MENLYEEYQAQKKLLIEALVEKDHMEMYESNLLKNDFVLKLGEPRYELHKLELTIARTKLKLDLMQTCIKLQIPIDTEQIDKQLEKEFEKHDSMLKSMKREIDNAHDPSNNSIVILQNTQQLKELYFSISSYVHPELVDNYDKNLKRIWKATKKAYQGGDTPKLKRLQKKVLNEYNDLSNRDRSDSNLEDIILTMKEKTKGVLIEIEGLKKQFPFNEAKMLEDEEAVVKFRKEIDVDIKIANELLDKLEKQILEKLPSPGRYIN